MTINEITKELGNLGHKEVCNNNMNSKVSSRGRLLQEAGIALLWLIQKAM